MGSVKEKLKSIGLIILFGFGPMGIMMACSPSPGSPMAEAAAQTITPVIDRYRIRHNQLLYDVILEDGSRCAITSNGGLHCEFVK